MLRLIHGPAGSGKSRLILDEIREECAREPMGPPLVLLVPEQASYLTERALLSGSMAGTMRARVLSFARLSQWVFTESPSSGLPRLSDGHRRVLLASLIAERRAAGTQGALARIPRIESALGDMLAEFRRFRVEPTRLESLANTLETQRPGLSRKLRELASLSVAFDEKARARFEDPDESLATLRRLLLDFAPLQGAQVYIDGFHGFTPVEIEVLRGVMQRCHRTTIALTIDLDRLEAIRLGGQPDELSRSFPTEETLMRLLAVATDDQVAVDTSRALGARGERPRFHSPGLTSIERGFLRADAPGAADGVRFLEAATRRDEARAAVEQIVAAHERDGIAWGRLALVARDLEQYAGDLVEFLNAARVPHFIDRHEPLATHPVIQGTLAAAEAALDSGPTSDAPLAFAKARLFGFDPDAVARLEDFLSTYPRPASAWFAEIAWMDPPRRSPFEDAEDEPDEPSARAAEAERVRRAVVEPLKRLRTEWRQGVSAGAWTWRAFLEPLCSLVAEAMPEPLPDDEPVLERFGELCAHLIEAGGEETFPRDVLLRVLQECLSTIELPRIPPQLGVVTIGQADRSRFGDLDLVVVVGLSEGQFPKAGGNATLLTDAERELLLDRVDGVELKASSRRLYLREAFLAYLAMTRASQQLVLMRPLTDGSGDEARPSRFWEEARRILGEPSVESLEPEHSFARSLRSRDAAAVLCREAFHTHEQRSPHQPAWPAGTALEGLSDRARAEFLHVVDGAHRRNAARLDPALARSFLKGRWRTSASRLESFAMCPFRHFVSAFLGPEVSTSTHMTPADTGNLAHAVLQAIARELIAEGRGFGDLDDEEAARRLDVAFKPPVDRLRAAGLLESAGAEAMVELLKGQLAALIGMLRVMGATMEARPVLAEGRFGVAEGLAGAAFTVMLPDGAELEVSLRGQIDRVDVMRAPGGATFLAVIDYKLGNRRAEWHKLADGSSIQLPVYLAVLAANREQLAKATNASLLGAFYARIVQGADDTRRLRGIIDATAIEQFGDPKELAFLSIGADATTETRARGDAISGPQFAALVASVPETVGRAARAIARGDVEVRPALWGTQTPCAECAYRDACRLDLSMNRRRPVPSPGRILAIEGWLGPAVGGGAS